MTDYWRAVEDPGIVARIAEILERQWDPRSTVRDGLRGDADFYREQAVIVAGMLSADARVAAMIGDPTRARMLSADARETEVQRYLRQLEQRALPVTLHPFEARHAIAVALWRAARGL